MCIWEGEVNDMLALEQVTASYGGSRVLFGVDIKAKKGEVTCLVGRNGVGKTTTVKSIMGLVSTPSGSITLDGKSIFKMPVYARAKSGIGYVPQGREIFPQLTVRENILLGMEANKKVREIPEHIYEIFPILKEFLDRKGGDLSGGQQQQLAIARAIVSNPKVLILDEPTIAQDAGGRRRLGGIVQKLALEGKMVLAILHDMDFAAAYFERMIVMAHGRVLADGPKSRVYYETDALSEARLEQPHVTGLCSCLGYEGSFLTVEDMAEAATDVTEPADVTEAASDMAEAASDMADADIVESTVDLDMAEADRHDGGK